MPMIIRFEAIKLSEKDYPLAILDRATSALEGVMRGQVSKLLTDQMEKRTAGWQHKPDFSSKFMKQVTQLRLDIMPAGQNKRYWEWNSAGTKPHTISARRKPNLRIRTGHNPYTKPGNVYGGSGTYSGDVFYTPAVQHPGTAPREFEKHIVRESEDDVFLLIAQTIERAIPT